MLLLILKHATLPANSSKNNYAVNCMVNKLYTNKTLQTYNLQSNSVKLSKFNLIFPLNFHFLDEAVRLNIACIQINIKS